MCTNLMILPGPPRQGGGPSHAGVTIGFGFQTCKGQEHESLAALQGPRRKIAHAFARKYMLKLVGASIQLRSTQHDIVKL